MQLHLLAQLPLKANAIAVAHNQHPDHKLGIDRRSANVAVEGRELLTQISQNPRHGRIDLMQQMACRNALFQVEQIEQLALIAPLPAHHDPPPVVDRIRQTESRVARNHEPFFNSSSLGNNFRRSPYHRLVRYLWRQLMRQLRPFVLDQLSHIAATRPQALAGTSFEAGRRIATGSPTTNLPRAVSRLSGGFVQSGAPIIFLQGVAADYFPPRRRRRSGLKAEREWRGSIAREFHNSELVFWFGRERSWLVPGYRCKWRPSDNLGGTIEGDHGEPQVP